MLDPGHDLPPGRGGALQLVGDEHTRGSPRLLEELAEPAFGGLVVAPALDENIENQAVLVDGTPQPMLLPSDADDNLIEGPFVAPARRSPTDAIGEFSAEFKAPLPDRLGRHRDAAGGQHLLHHAPAQRQPKTPPKIPPYPVADDLSRVAIASVNWVSRRRHPARLPDPLGSHQACSRANLTVPSKCIVAKGNTPERRRGNRARSCPVHQLRTRIRNVSAMEPNEDDKIFPLLRVLLWLGLPFALTTCLILLS